MERICGKMGREAVILPENYSRRYSEFFLRGTEDLACDPRAAHPDDNNGFRFRALKPSEISRGYVPRPQLVSESKYIFFVMIGHLMTLRVFRCHSPMLRNRSDGSAMNPGFTPFRF